jgi:hypothetical protein
MAINDKSSLHVKSRVGMFRYTVSSINFISNTPFAFIVSHEDVMFAENVVEDSEFLLARLCLLVEEILPSTLVHSAL